MLDAAELGKLPKNKAFLAMNPTGKVPTLELADGSAVWQSNAIARYIARLGPSANLLGGSFQEQSQVDQWLDFCINEIEVPSTMLYYPALGFQNVNGDTAKAAEKFFMEALKCLDSHLLTRTFVVGSSLTLADIALASALFYPFKFVLDKGLRKQVGNVVRWFQFIAGQDEFRGVAGDAAMCSKRVAMPKSTGGKAAPAGKKKKQKQKNQKHLQNLKVRMTLLKNYLNQPWSLTLGKKSTPVPLKRKKAKHKSWMNFSTTLTQLATVYGMLVTITTTIILCCGKLEI